MIGRMGFFGLLFAAATSATAFFATHILKNYKLNLIQLYHLYYQAENGTNGIV